MKRRVAEPAKRSQKNKPAAAAAAAPSSPREGDMTKPKKSKQHLSERKASIAYEEVIPYVEVDDMTGYIPYDSSSSSSSSSSSRTTSPTKKGSVAPGRSKVKANNKLKRARTEKADNSSHRHDSHHSTPPPEIIVQPWKPPAIPAAWAKLVPQAPQDVPREHHLMKEAGLCRIERRRAAIESSSYIADEVDMKWCLAHSVPIALFSEIVTKLDRLFAEILLQQFRQAQESPMQKTLDAAAGDKSTAAQAASSARYCGGCGTSCREDASCITCKTCGVTAHRACAQLPLAEALPQRWKCDVCRNMDDSEAVRCAICERGGGLFLMMQAQNASWTRYGHVSCALLLPELRIDSKTRTIVVENRFDRRRLQMCCIDCGKIGTPCVQCHNPRCFAAMHASCAVAARRQETRRCTLKPTEPVDVHAVYCPQHFSAIYDISSAVGADSKGNAGTVAEQYAVQNIVKAMQTSSPVLLPQAEPSRKKDRSSAPAGDVTNAVCQYWISKREARMKESAALVAKINNGQADVMQALYRPEIMKIAPDKVHLARFLCLTPEIQLFTAEMIEGVAPIKDYHKVAVRQTRRSGNTDALFGTMVRVQDQIKQVGGICQNLKARVELSAQVVALDLRLLDGELADALRKGQ